MNQSQGTRLSLSCELVLCTLNYKLARLNISRSKILLSQIVDIIGINWIHVFHASRASCQTYTKSFTIRTDYPEGINYYFPE